MGREALETGLIAEETMNVDEKHKPFVILFRGVIDERVSRGRSKVLIRP